jgi:UDP-2,4-diacetamido-2,4,6-trideoxy-beta-L-altropyranose hydrolase
MNGPRILFIADAGPQVGGGHVMRSLTLAQALIARGGTCAFLGAPEVDAVLNAFAPDMARVNADLADAAAVLEATDEDAFDAVVFDHYGLRAADHREIGRGRPALVIDDLADRPLGGDLVVDSGLKRRAEDYQGLIPPGARLLLGPAYAPVRPEFAALRGQALARPPGPVRRVLVSMGLTDLGGVTARVLDRLRRRIGEARVDVVLGEAAPSRAGLEKLARRDTRLAVHVDTPRMAELTAQADFAVGAAGSSAWERCTLALPSVLLILAENQRPAAEALNGLGAALVVDPEAPDFDELFDRAVQRLLSDPTARARMAARSAEVCDGLGAARTADAFLEVIATRDGMPRANGDFS